MAVNIRAGRIVQGGSTITQQTAKNLFKRKDRSLGAKVKELVYALRLEYNYPKEKILEFYANQFYVSGNGRGLGVAARYYFDKDASDLDLVECAFIAGSVKKPNYYNPFIKNSPEEKEKARRAAKKRVAYVLRQMYRNHYIDRDTLDAALARDIPFRQGRMTYSLNTVMDLVKSALTDPDMEEVLRRHGIDNVATSGVKVITTVERPLQQSAVYALRKELSRLSVRLDGYDHARLQERYASMPLGRDEVKAGDFLMARVVEADPGKGTISVAFSPADRVDGVIDSRGIRGVLVSLAKYERELWSTPGRGDLARFVRSFSPGELVFVSVRKDDRRPFALDLEKYPGLQGAALAYREGSIRAMAGGFENRFFNRAIYARRPMGSVMKPLVYTAAIQLGWNSIDALDNRRDVFVFQGRPYFPRPDHESASARVSMSWAGVHSENVATVWLLYHLCDHLNDAQFRELLDNLGLGLMPGEQQADYRARIRDSFGIVVDKPQLYRIAFERAVAGLEPDLIFSGLMDEYEFLKTMHYGYGFDRFDEEVETDLGLDRDVDEEALSPRQRVEYRKKKKEARLRHEILRRSYLRFAELYDAFVRLRDGDILADGDPNEVVLYQDKASGAFFVSDRDDLDGTAVPVTRAELAMRLDLMDEEARAAFWKGVKLDNAISVDTFAGLKNAVEDEYGKIASLPPYSPEVLYQVRDFRVMAALLYLTGFCREIGIESKLDPVLSFPLGSNVITPLEVARAYEALATGEVITMNGRGFSVGLSIIKRIEDSDGDVIYEAEPRRRRVIAPEVVLEVSDILRNVVRHGTGRYANRHVRLHSRDPERDRQLADLDLAVPVAGKTGTANRFTNAAFAGIIPGVGQGGLFSLADGYVLATYVGYDDNKPMVRTSSHMTGAAGALPMWTRIANTILLVNDESAGLDLVDLAFNGVSELPLAHPGSGYLEVPVDAEHGGLPAGEDSGVEILTYGEPLGGGRIKPARFFRPYWRTEGDNNETMPGQ
jgi:membrane peptidoglycan carboxypeptidase